MFYPKEYKVKVKKMVKSSKLFFALFRADNLSSFN